MKKTGKTLVTSSIMLLSLLTQLAYADETTMTKPVEEKKMETLSTPQEKVDKPVVTENPLKMSGFVDAYYSTNFYFPESRANRLRNFDIYSNQFGFNMAKLKFQKDPGPIGFDVELAFGSATDLVHTIDNKVDETFKNLHQAYGTVAIPVGNTLSIDVGKFVTHLGSEVIETNANWNYSRSLLFSWAIPYFHTGLRATYPINRYVTVMGMVSNGSNRIIDNNDGKTFGGQIVLTPIENLSIIENLIGGPEQANNNSDWRSITDTVISWQPIPKLGLNVNFDYGMEKIKTSNQTWLGVSGMARYAITDRVAIAARGEWFNDPDGLQTGTAQQLQEATLTAEWRPFVSNLLLRAELRRDWSNAKSFDPLDTQKDPKSTKTDQNTFLVGAVFEF